MRIPKHIILIPFILIYTNNTFCEVVSNGTCFHLSLSSQEEDINELILKLRHKDPEVRINAIKALEEIKTPQVVEALIFALKDKDLEVRLSATKALGKLKDSQAIDPLIHKLKDKNLNVRAEAVNALKNIEDSRVVDKLIAALKASTILIVKRCCM